LTIKYNHFDGYIGEPGVPKTSSAATTFLYARLSVKGRLSL